jgi:4-amino-4-deoxy-L-arabinose transferase-like glycosyltransferase
VRVPKRVASLLLAAVLAHGAWAFVVHARAPLLSPWSRDYGEGSVLAMAQLLANGRSYFVDLRDYPFLLGNYPPVFVGLTALSQVLFGPTLLAPRLLSLLASLGLLAVLLALLRHLLGDLCVALAFSALLVMPWFVTTWAALARVDMTAIFFSFAGLAVVIRRGPTLRAWPALVLFWLAFFTKQNAVLAPAAVLLDLLLGRDRRFLRALAAYAGPLVALFGALLLATRGGAWRPLVTWTAAADYEWGRMGDSYLHLAVMAGPLLALIASALMAVPRAVLEGPGRLLLVYFLLNLAGLATIAKAGAAQCYFIEPWLATLPLAAWALRALGERFRAVRSWWPAVLLAAAAVPTYMNLSLDRLPQALRRPDRATEFFTLTRLVRETPGPILCENMCVLVVNRRPVLLDPWGIVMLARKGVFRPDRLVRDCETGRFPLVVVERRMWDIPDFGECLERRYQPLADLGPYQALRPRPQATAP